MLPRCRLSSNPFITTTFTTFYHTGAMGYHVPGLVCATDRFVPRPISTGPSVRLLGTYWFWLDVSAKFFCARS